MLTQKKQRNFTVGDKWLYYKIYTGFKTSDIILTEIISPISNKLLNAKIIDKWFFIRYLDPENHIRLRFYCSKPKDISQTISTLKPLLDEYLASGLIWNIQIDTYQREIERYGEKTIELSEELFFHDSIMIVEFIDLIEGAEGEELRWLFCMKAINHFLETFGYTNKEKINLTEGLKNSYFNEFKVNKTIKDQINEKYRANRNIIEDFIINTRKGDDVFYEIDDILAKKNNSISEIAKKIIDIKKNNTTDFDFNYFITSHIHMLTNRLFKSKGRQNEMVIYDFLYKYYKTTEAKSIVKL